VGSQYRTATVDPLILEKTIEGLPINIQKIIFKYIFKSTNGLFKNNSKLKFCRTSKVCSDYMIYQHYNGFPLKQLPSAAVRYWLPTQRTDSHFNYMSIILREKFPKLSTNYPDLMYMMANSLWPVKSSITLSGIKMTLDHTTFILQNDNVTKYFPRFPPFKVQLPMNIAFTLNDYVFNEFVNPLKAEVQISDSKFIDSKFERGYDLQSDNNYLFEVKYAATEHIPFHFHLIMAVRKNALSTQNLGSCTGLLVFHVQHAQRKPILSINPKQWEKQENLKMVFTFVTIVNMNLELLTHQELVANF
jgi:hypothetical protein